MFYTFSKAICIGRKPMIHLFSGMMVVLFAFLIANCGDAPSEPSSDVLNQPWDSIKQGALGSSVTFMMWQGNPELNNYINNYVVPAVRDRFGIDLNISGGQGPEIVQLIMSEKEASAKNGQADIVWINGETFFQLRKIEGLWGPFVQKLPNAEYIDFENPFINTDFQQPVDGMECPWGIGQFALVYDSAKVSRPPATLEELEEYVRENPGTFTISNDFTGMTLLKSFLAELSRSPNGLNGPFDEEKYNRLSTKLWKYINRNKQYFWKRGHTFPEEHSRLDQMYATGEIDITYGFGEGGFEEKVREGLFPKTTRAYAWKNGTIRNSNYLGIPYNSGNRAGAMMVINFLISPEAQYRRSSRKGTRSNPILEMNRLPERWQQKFDRLPEHNYEPAIEDLTERAIPEPAPQYIIRLFEDFRTEVIEQ